MSSESSLQTCGHLFILSAPAGTGKTTLVNRLKDDFPDLRETVSCTTRAPREGEVHGVDYFFMTRTQFKQALQEGAFLEWVQLYNDYYGTLHNQVQTLLQQGHHVILVIDTQGTLKLRGKLNATTIFISPPSLEELARRLRDRGTESSEAIEKRLTWASHEIAQAGLYDYEVVNDNFEDAYQRLKNIILKEGSNCGIMN